MPAALRQETPNGAGPLCKQRRHSREKASKGGGAGEAPGGAFVKAKVAERENGGRYWDDLRRQRRILARPADPPRAGPGAVFFVVVVVCRSVGRRRRRRRRCRLFSSLLSSL